MTQLCPKDCIELLKDTFVGQILELNEYPFYYSVIQFGFFDNYGSRLGQDQIAKYYRQEEVSNTCRFIRNKIKEALQPLQQYYLLERHAPILDEDGDVVRDGRFHINLLISPISDEAVLEPNRKCRRLLKEPDYGRFGLPIENNTYSDVEDYKIALIDACIRTSDWVNRYQYSVKTQLVETPDDLNNVARYSLKSYKTNKKDFVDIVEFSSSDFYSK